ncbi:hypothetical protein QYM36_001234 [Artemia franciscana]|uniref:Death domain-containing protein n=2 Tax=Artemia franciscana TaxID=6661 RepID=A0AA88IQ64_ARTSF|nr:hypothetical protein QYM36_001234 [Artemia franciscana]
MASQRVRYIYDLPLFARKELCRVIDETGKWEDLGGNYMGLSVSTLKEIQRNTTVRAMSPTDYLLDLLGQKNHTVDYLFVLLSKMQHYRGMSAIKDFVDPKLLPLLSEGELNLSRIVAGRSQHPKRPPTNDSGAPKFQSVNQPSVNQPSALSSVSTTGYGSNIDKPTIKELFGKSLHPNEEYRVPNTPPAQNAPNVLPVDNMSKSHAENPRKAENINLPDGQDPSK